MVNMVVLVGRLAQDPECRHTTQGTAVANCGIAVDSGFGEHQKTLFLDVVVWGKQAENFSKYMRKGKLCYISGRLEKREWERNGEKKSKVEVVASEIKFLSPKQETSAPPAEAVGKNNKEPF